MGLNPRDRGPGRGRQGNFQNEVWRRTGSVSHEAVYTSGPAGMFYPGTSYCGPQVFGGPSEFGINSLSPPCGNISQNNTINSQLMGGNDSLLVHGTVFKNHHFSQRFKHENKRQRFSTMGKKPKPYQNWNAYKVLARGNNSGSKNHYCETCDKSFRTEEDLSLHKAEHETCGHDGCEFTAHPKIIAKHIKMQHESGLYKRIGNLYTEEDIAKWIEERKKRYPTRKVIEDKKILEEEKIKRGERIKDDDSKFNKCFNKKNRKHWKKNFEKQNHKTTKNRRTRKRNEISLQKHIEEEQAEEVRKGVPAFSGIRNTSEQELLEKTECNISDDEWQAACESSNFSKPFLNSSLGLLAECYNSDEDNPNQQLQNNIKENISADEESGPEEVKTIFSRNPLLEEKSNEKKAFLKRKVLEKKELIKKKRENTYKQFNTQERNVTLLEKLLKKEIRHERNVILQCIHYIVTHNFFKT